MSRENPTTDCGSAEPCFEEALEQLEAVVHDLEEGQIGLADALGRYEQGVKLLRQCYGLLEKAERRIELLSGVDAQGNPITQSFDDQSSLALDEQAARRRAGPAAKPRVKRAGPTEVPSDEAGMDGPRGLF